MDLPPAKKLYTPVEFRFGGLYESSSSFVKPSLLTPFPTDSPQKVPLIPHWPKIMNIGPGFENLGNTCFFNSVLQCLTYTPPLAGYFLHEKAHSPNECAKDRGSCWLCLLWKHFRSVFGEAKQHKTISPVEIIKCLKGAWKKFRLGSQEDSHEFLRIFLDNVQKADKSLIHEIYAGKLKNQVQCLECKAISEKSDPFLDLSLEVQKSDSIEKSLEIFFKKESLTGNNKYRCGKCKKLVNAWKGFELEEGPMILTIHLKRFNNYLMKINKYVKFTEKLDLRKFTRDPKKPLAYELFAVVVHQGSQMWSGHYYSYVRNSNNLWYCMNDESVRMASLERVFREHAYLLFYVRKDPSIPNHMQSDVQKEGVNGINPVKLNGTMNNGKLTNNSNGNIAETAENNNPKKSTEKLKINGNISNDSTAGTLSEAQKKSKNEEDYAKKLSKVKETEECREYLDSIFKKSQKATPNGLPNLQSLPPKPFQNQASQVEKVQNSQNPKESQIEVEISPPVENASKPQIVLDAIIPVKRSKLKKLRKLSSFDFESTFKKRKIESTAITICVSDSKLEKVKSIDEIFAKSQSIEYDSDPETEALKSAKQHVLESNSGYFEHRHREKDPYDIEYDRGKVKKKRAKREAKRNDFQRALEQKSHRFVPRR